MTCEFCSRSLRLLIRQAMHCSTMRPRCKCCVRTVLHFQRYLKNRFAFADFQFASLCERSNFRDSMILSRFAIFMEDAGCIHAAELLYWRALVVNPNDFECLELYSNFLFNVVHDGSLSEFVAQRCSIVFKLKNSPEDVTRAFEEFSAVVSSDLQYEPVQVQQEAPKQVLHRFVKASYTEKTEKIHCPKCSEPVKKGKVAQCEICSKMFHEKCAKKASGVMYCS
jgi:hypothetical protein